MTPRSCSRAASTSRWRIRLGNLPRRSRRAADRPAGRCRLVYEPIADLARGRSAATRRIERFPGAIDAEHGGSRRRGAASTRTSTRSPSRRRWRRAKACRRSRSCPSTCAPRRSCARPCGRRSSGRAGSTASSSAWLARAPARAAGAAGGGRGPARGRREDGGRRRRQRHRDAPARDRAAAGRRSCTRGSSPASTATTRGARSSRHRPAASQLDGLVVAQGVSAIAELDALMSLRVPFAQGPLIGVRAKTLTPVAFVLSAYVRGAWRRGARCRAARRAARHARTPSSTTRRASSSTPRSGRTGRCASCRSVDARRQPVAIAGADAPCSRRAAGARRAGRDGGESADRRRRARDAASPRDALPSARVLRRERALRGPGARERLVLALAAEAGDGTGSPVAAR